jgi:hypothetical protein
VGIPTATPNKTRELLKIRFGRVAASEGSAISLEPCSDPEFSFFVENCDYSAIVCSDEVKYDFSYLDRPCLSLRRSEADEYGFFVAHPLSCFLGFAISIALLQKERHAWK